MTMRITDACSKFLLELAREGTIDAEAFELLDRSGGANKAQTSLLLTIAKYADDDLRRSCSTQYSGINLQIDNPARLRSSVQRNRAIVYAKRSFLITQAASASVDTEDHPDVAGGLAEPYVKCSMLELGKCILDHAAAVRRGVFVPLPRRVRAIDVVALSTDMLRELEDCIEGPDTIEVVEDAPSLDMRILRSTEPSMDVVNNRECSEIADYAKRLTSFEREWELPTGTLRVASNGPALLADSSTLPVGLLMPLLETANTLDVLRFRHDYEESFERFQRAVASFCCKLSGDDIDDETRLRAIFEEVEFESAQLSDELARLRRRYASLGITGSVVCMVFLLVIQNPLLRSVVERALASFVGGGLLATSGLAHAHSRVAAEPFFFPMKLANHLRAST